MPLMIWKDSMAVNVEEIDNQHRAMLQSINVRKTTRQSAFRTLNQPVTFMTASLSSQDSTHLLIKKGMPTKRHPFFY